ncbi:MAG: hypothetical protein M1453_03120 [Acidobacteria bacterium]|nr:hypothetical protein [Acidobacteriota bacterium]MCL5286971.1 hypothetical protein [Acidobacteriota bacterium]
MQWEYEYLTFEQMNPAEGKSFEEQLWAMGNDGWEAVTAWPLHGHSEGLTLILFKRPKETDSPSK